MTQIPSQIPLALRGLIGDPLTNEQIDGNLTRLRDAILGMAATLGEDGGRIIVSPTEPDANNRTNVLWVKNDYSGVYLWDSGDEEWKVVGDEVYYAATTGSSGNYVATMPRNQTYAQLTGRMIIIKPNHTNTAAEATLEITGNDDPLPIQAVEGSDVGIGVIGENELKFLVCLGDHFRLINWNSDADAAPTIYLGSDGAIDTDYSLPAGYTKVEIIAQADGGPCGPNKRGSAGTAIGYGWGGDGGDGGSIHAIISGFSGDGPHLKIKRVAEVENDNPLYPPHLGYVEIKALPSVGDPIGFKLTNGGQGAVGVVLDAGSGEGTALVGATGSSLVEQYTPTSSRVTVLGNGKNPYYGVGGRGGLSKGYRTLYLSGNSADDPFPGTVSADLPNGYDPTELPYMCSLHADWIGSKGRVWIRPVA